MADLVSGNRGVAVAGVVFRTDGLQGTVRLLDRGTADRDGGHHPALDALVAGVGRRADMAPAEAFTVEMSPGPTRDGTGAGTLSVDVPKGDEVPVLLTQDGDGLLTWQLPEGFDPAHGPPAGARGGPLDAYRFEVPITATAPSGERGLVSLLAKKVLQVVAVKWFDPVLQSAGGLVARRIERNRVHRLRRFTPDLHRDPDAAEVDAEHLRALAAAGPVLLFLHGTNSLSHSGFHDLPTEVLRALAARYDGRVLAFDHPTLSVDPAANAAALAERLLPGSRLGLDIIAHSRGGLVARELVERGDRHGLRERLDVHRVVFVATPNAGTPFCQPDHLTGYIDMLSNGLTILPDNGITDAVDGVLSLLSVVVRAGYEGVPGAMAMNPAGSYLAELNGAPDPGSCRYFGVAADYEPVATDGWKRRARDLIVDQVMGSRANDLIVPTDSIWESTSLRMADTRRLAPDRHVDHSGYWTSHEWRRAVEEWLDRPSIAVTSQSVAPTATVEAAVDEDQEPGVGPDPAPLEAAAPDTLRVIGGQRRGSPARDASDDNQPPPKEVFVEVVHGSLEHASYPLVVGHHTGHTVAGALGHLDRKYGWAITRRSYLRLLPEAAAEIHMIRLPRHNRPPGAIIVSLGPSDSITLGRLTRCTTQATLERLMDVVEQHSGRDPGAAIGLSMVLLGTGRPAGLPVPAAVPAILEGVLRANQLVADIMRPMEQAETAQAPYVAHLEFVEIHRDQAEVAARALAADYGATTSGTRAAIEAAAPRFTITLATDVRAGEGGRPGLPSDDDRELGWRTLRVRQIGEPRQYGPSPDQRVSELEFTAIGELAGVGSVRLPVDHAVIDPLLARAQQRPDPDDEVHVALYQLLLPHEIKAPLISSGNVKLVLDPSVANHPWEMLAAQGEGGEVRPISLQGGFLRQLHLDTPPPTRRRATGKRALVLGNLPGGPAYANLPGAAREAQGVADLLDAAGYHVDALVFDERGRPPPGEPPTDAWWERVLTRFFAHEYQVIHIASHGRFESGEPLQSGVVIGAGHFITPQALRQLPVVPDFVFMNCCHLGSIDTDRPASAGTPGPLTGPGVLAASAARELMASGVRAVVAAGWAVNDHDAETFARVLYQQLLAGAVYGDAVREARLAIGPDGTSTSSTWGAYQCYGDGGFRLQLGAREARPLGRPGREGAGPRPWLVSDLERWLDEIVSEAGDVDSAPSRTHAHQALRARINGLEELATGEHRATPAVWYRLGRSYAEIAQYDDAIRCFDQALEGGLSAGYPAKLFEEYANLEVRRAQQLFRASQGAPSGIAARAIDASFERADTQLDALGALYSSNELAGLWGSYYKKRAATRTGEAQHADARQALMWYGTAIESGRTYQRLNHTQLAYLIDRTPPPPPPSPESPHPERHAAREWVDYWDRVGEVDQQLTDALTGGMIATDRPALRAAYEQVFRERSTWKERDSTIDHLWDLARLHFDDAERAALLDLWAELRQQWQE